MALVCYLCEQWISGGAAGLPDQLSNISLDNISYGNTTLLAAGAYEAPTARLGHAVLESVTARGGLLGGARFAEAHIQFVNNYEQVWPRGNVPTERDPTLAV